MSVGLAGTKCGSRAARSDKDELCQTSPRAKAFGKREDGYSGSWTDSAEHLTKCIASKSKHER